MNPLKQGLRLVIRCFYIFITTVVKEVNPLKQGLRRCLILFVQLIELQVKEVNPLKQGLRHFSSSTISICGVIC